MVASICAAVMSTCDGGLIAGSANIVNDIYLKVINPDGEADQKKLSTITTVSTLVMGILALLISLQFTNLIPVAFSGIQPDQCWCSYYDCRRRFLEESNKGRCNCKLYCWRWPDAS